MSIITLFQEKIKPYKLRGTGMLNPVSTSKIDKNLYAIRQDDVNFWIYEKNNMFIAIDAGYKDDVRLDFSLKNLGISNESIKFMFITHADIDHVGGIVSNNRFAPNAKVFLHKDEENMILGTEKRFSVAGIKLKNPVNYTGEYTLFEDNQLIIIGDIEIRCYHTPGHTKGHSAFLVDDKYLFTGDSLAINDAGGYCFFDFYNMDTKQNILSLKKLKKLFENNPSITVCTSHNGIHSIENSFSHIDQIAKGTKNTPFDKTAPYDIFE